MNILIRSIAFCLLFLSIVSHARGQSETYARLPHHIVKIAWSQDGTRYATGQIGGGVRVYNGSALFTSIPNAHTDSVIALAFSPDGSRLATGSRDRSLKVWNVNNGNLLAEFEDVGIVISIFWGWDSSFIWGVPGTGREDILIDADVASDQYTFTHTLRIASSDDVVWKPDHSVIAFAGFGMDVCIVEPVNFSIIRCVDATPDFDPFEPRNEYPRSIAWHPNANLVANGNINGWIQIWDLDSQSDNQPLLSLQANPNARSDAGASLDYAVEDIVFSADGHIISSLSTDGTLRAWDSENGQLLSDVNVGERIRAGAFSPNGDELVYSTYTLTESPPVLLQSPTANAGLDQTVTDSDGDGFAQVALDGSGSSDPDGTIVAYEWFEGAILLASGVSPSAALPVGVHPLRLVVTDDDGLTAEDEVVVTVLAPTPTPTPTPTSTPTPTPTPTVGSGLRGQYYNNSDFTNLVLVRLDPTVSFSWANNVPVSGVDADTFSIRWTGDIESPISGNITFTTFSNDGARLWVNGTQIINDWSSGDTRYNSGTISLQAGQRYPIRLDYFEGTGSAQVSLLWSYSGQARQIIPSSRLFSESIIDNCPDGDDLNNTLTCTAYDNNGINGRNGNDTLTLGAGADVRERVTGFNGSDLITVQNGARIDDELYGGFGNDTLTVESGGVVTDTIYAGNDQDRVVIESSGVGTVHAGSGDDTLIYNGNLSGSQAAWGREGTDVLDVSGLSFPVQVTVTGADSGTITGGGFTLTYTGIEQVIE
jgi:WD40 repeat protein